MKIKFAVHTCFLVATIFLIMRNVQIYYQYQTAIGSYWDLSDRASSLPVKAAYLDQFVAALQGAKLAEYDAVIFKTPESSREQNLKALLSLQTRMHEIQNMDPTSFQYQQAISQITAQEQGEAESMLDRLEGLWYLANHPAFWIWYQLVVWGVLIVAWSAAGIVCSVFGDDWP